jgi:hypothetical protein
MLTEKMNNVTNMWSFDIRGAVLEAQGFKELEWYRNIELSTSMQRRAGIVIDRVNIRICF